MLRRLNYRKFVALVVLCIYLSSYFFNVPFQFLKLTHAVDLTEAAVRLDRMDVSHVATTTDPIVVFAKITSTATEDTVKITFASGFTVDSTPANITVSKTCSQGATLQGEAATDWPPTGTTAATSVSGQNVTIDSDDLTPGTLYSFCITGGITNPGSAGEKEITITTQTSGAAAIDTKTVAVDIVSDNADQVSVSANVTPTFNFALSGNSIVLGDLSTSTTTTGNITVDIDTNAGNGWQAWVKSTNAGLLSASTSDQIDTQGTLDDDPTAYGAGNEHYQAFVTVTNGTGAGTPSAANEYNNGESDDGRGGSLTTAYSSIATSTGVGSNDGITFKVYAAASSINEAADDYTDTLTIIGAGNF
jgi:hypothetical protein